MARTLFRTSSGDRVYTIYRATNNVNGKTYVGFDSNWPFRRGAHLRAAKKGTQNKFYRAIRKHGPEAFEWDVLYQSNDGEHTLTVMEAHFIAEWDSFCHGYNMTLGGEGILGFKHGPRSSEHAAKIGAANRGRVHSQETRLKISKLVRGRKHSDVTKDKMRESALCRRSPAPMKGKRHSPEAIAKMRLAKKGKPGRVWTETSKLKASKSHKGSTFSPEARQKIRDSVKRNWDLIKSTGGENWRELRKNQPDA